jgi:hypothetical protein
MITDPFPQLPADARLWVIALDAPAGQGQDRSLEDDLAEVLGRWRHKGNAYQAAWTILEDRVILVAEPHMATDPSGCAIDGMLRKVQRAAEAHGRRALDEDTILVRLPEGLCGISRNELGARISDGTLQADTPVLDRALHHLGQLREGRFERPLASTWIGRKFKVAAGVPS